MAAAIETVVSQGRLNIKADPRTEGSEGGFR